MSQVKKAGNDNKDIMCSCTNRHTRQDQSHFVAKTDYKMMVGKY